MSKNKCGIVKNKKKKVPFNVLSKKGLMAIAISGVMAFSPLMLAGCSNGQDGKNGTNGSTWYSGTEYSPTQGVVGDFFYDTDDFNIYTKTEDGWTLISNIKGPQGEEGEKGQDGITPTITINEDGYWVINGVTTSTKAEGQDGVTPTITINSDGYWVINGVTTSTKAEGQDGVTPTITHQGEEPPLQPHRRPH